MKKQILSMALAVCMIGTVCSGCGQTTQDASSLNLKSLESEKKDKNAAVELTVWGAEEDQDPFDVHHIRLLMAISSCSRSR